MKSRSDLSVSKSFAPNLLMAIVRPDIYASDNSLGIEATSACGINCKIFKRVDGEIVTENLNYNHLEGKKYKCMRETGIVNPELCFAIDFHNFSPF